MRIGIGRDFHRLVDGRKLLLGGVLVDEERGAAAHSDGDALLHAIIDAMFGAAGLGDIGDNFPDTDPQYKGADSRKLLRHAVALLAERKLRVAQVDANIMLERPKLGGLKPVIRQAIAKDLDLLVYQVNVKAKTNEGMDAVGRGEAVAAEAIVVLEEIS